MVVFGDGCQELGKIAVFFGQFIHHCIIHLLFIFRGRQDFALAEVGRVQQNDADAETLAEFLQGFTELPSCGTDNATK